jgi:hypothetical protein
LSKLSKYTALCLLLILASTMILSLGPTANAQDETAEVIILAAAGGTTDPAGSTTPYTYSENETITITATPDTGFKFSHWVIQGVYTPGHPNLAPINVPINAYNDPNWTPSLPTPSETEQNSLVSSQNPLKIICGYGYTFIYQPVFEPVSSTPPTSNNAVVIVLSATGGTTDPSPGTYTYTPDETIKLTATPDSGFEFLYWIATGAEPGHDAVLLDSSLDINCQAGYTYTYQPVFAPTGSTTTSGGGVPAEYLYAIIIVLVIIAVIGIGAALMYRGRSK